VMLGIQQFANKETADQLRETMRTLQRTLSATERTLNLYADANKGPTAELTRTMRSFQRLSARLDSTLGSPALARALDRSDTLTGNLAATTEQLGAMTARLDTLLIGVNEGRGTLGKFATDSGLYHDMRELSAAMKDLIGDLRKNPGKIGVTVKVF
jgi:phospholipid/cholesterol/gamma-HCH transport system substrate-binding protein